MLMPFVASVGTVVLVVVKLEVVEAVSASVGAAAVGRIVEDMAVD